MTSPAGPRVTVITATYNWTEALREAIASVQAQTFTDFEHLVVGDGCSDDTEAVVEEISARDPRVRWIGLPENSGNQAAPNNAGLRGARGELIAYLGHDDVWLPGHLATLVAAIDAEGADVAWSVALLIGSDGRRAVTGIDDPLPGERTPHFPPCTMIHRRDTAESNGGWSPPEEAGQTFDHTFGSRLIAARGRWARTGRLTAVKFPASWFPDAYLHRQAGQQRDVRRLAGSDLPALLERELVATLAAADRGVFVAGAGAPPPEAADDLLRSVRIRKGAQRFRLAERVVRAAVDLGRPLLGPGEWHGPEQHPVAGAFQWTGPLSCSTVHFPLDRREALALEIDVLHVLSHETLQALEVIADGQPLAARIENLADGPAIARVIAELPPADMPDEAPATRIDIRVPATSRPPGDSDQRLLGVAVSRIAVAPLA